ncbi:LURP-one-related/scramblase family protein [Halorussus sp. AFM4]|uniref:LURP-one-related/scramblase family protein n=1 Tax=Halorussus sp. AFM4 TaxID=3421651 RepID=UPI003EB81F96
MVSDIAALDLTDDEYTVVQSPIRNKYKAYDAAGDLVLRGKQKLFKLKEEFPFVDAEGNPAFTVKAGGVFDFAGDYALVDDRTGETVVVLDRNFTFVVDKWTLRDPDTGNPVAEITSKSRLVSFLRHLSELFGLIPHEYEITAPDGRHVGTIDGRFSLKDTYDVTIDDDAGIPKEAVVAAAMVVDAIEGN